MNKPTSTLTRRDALNRMAFGAAMLAGSIPAALGQVPALPAPAQLRSDPDGYWARIRREQFLIPEDRAFLNNGSLGVTPRPVLSAMVDYLERAAALEMEDTPRWGYETRRRAEMAEFLGCHQDGLAFTHNCTEAMSIIANGLDLQPGDEVILARNMPAGRCAGDQESGRTGASRDSRHRVSLRISPTAIRHRRTACWFRDHDDDGRSSNSCQAARDKGVLSVVNGAHGTAKSRRTCAILAATTLRAVRTNGYSPRQAAEFLGGRPADKSWRYRLRAMG